MPISLALGIVAIINLAIGYALALVIEGSRQSATEAIPAYPDLPGGAPPAPPPTRESPAAPTELAESALTQPAGPVEPDAGGEQLLQSVAVLAEELKEFSQREGATDQPSITAVVPAQTSRDSPQAASTSKQAPAEPPPSPPELDLAPVEPQATIATPTELEAAFHDWRQNDPEGVQPLCVGQIEIDHVPKLMAKLDVAALNDLAKQVERLAQGMLRKGDLLAPLGRSRFLVAMPGVGGPAAAQLLESLRSRMERTDFSTDAGPIRATLSASATQARNDESLESLLARSASALREACREGRNRIACDDGKVVSFANSWATDLNR